MFHICLVGIKVVPEKFIFGKIPLNQPARAKVRITKQDAPNLLILGLKAKEEYPFSVYKIEVIETGKEYEIEIGVGPDRELGPIEDTIRVFLDDEERPHLDIPVTGEVVAAPDVAMGK